MSTPFITHSDLYLMVPFEEKEAAKERGAKWDREHKLWFAPTGLDPLEFRDWWSFLAPAYKDRELLKKRGAKYHAGLKSWYVPRSGDSDLEFDDFRDWWPDDCKAYLFNDRFAVHELHASGGQSFVFRGYDLTDDSECAIKLFNLDEDGDDEITESFKREHDALIQLDGHPNILRLIDWGRHESTGRYFTVTPWMYGTLADAFEPEEWLRTLYRTRHSDSELSEDEFVAEIMKELETSDGDDWLDEFEGDGAGLEGILSGLLHAAHSSIIHRDIKPSNVFLDIIHHPNSYEPDGKDPGPTGRIEALIECGKRAGYVTYDDIDEALGERHLDTEELEDLLDDLSSHGFDMVDQDELRYVIGDFGAAKNWENEEANKNTLFGVRSVPWTPMREGNERYFESTFDGYSWGVIAIAVITDTLPESRDDIEQLLDGPFREKVGDDIHEFISRVVSSDPTRRPQNIEALAEELELLNTRRREALHP
jgi:serine/threonine protein kinase